MPNLKELKNISLFKVTFFLLISIYLKNYLLILLISIYLFKTNKNDLYLYLFLLIFIYLINNISFDFIKIGVVDYKNNDYYLIDSGLFKTKLYTDNNYSFGDFLIIDDLNKTSSSSLINKNIIYFASNGKKIFNFPLRKIIEKRLDFFSYETKSILKRYLYNIHDYDSLYDLGYGLFSYYLLNDIRKKNKKICFVLIIIYSLLFCYDYKYNFLLIDIIFEDFDKADRLSLKIIFLELLNPNLLFNSSFYIPLIINLYSIYEFEVSFKCYFLIISSLFFKEINLFSFFFKQYIKLQEIIFVFSLLLLIFPILEPIYLSLIYLIDKINKFNFSLRGSINIFNLFLIYFLIFKKYKVNNYLQLLIIVLLIILPINDPFMSVNFIDVNQGDATLIKYPLNSGNVLIDTGSKYNYLKLKKFLFSKGIYEIDYLIISHDDEDHNGNLENLKKDFKIKNIIDKKTSFSFNDLEFINYDLGEFDNLNDNSLIYEINIDGLSFLFTGDISSFVEKIFIKNNYLKTYDVLKVSHHGSKSASSIDFISKISSRFAIISTNGMYYHPHQITLDTLNKYEVETLITKDEGSISFKFNRFFKYIITDRFKIIFLT